MNKKMKCVHPRKAKKIMEEFINSIHSQTYKFNVIPPEFANADTFTQFLNSEIEMNPASCKMVKSNRFSAYVSDKGKSEFRITYDFEQLKCREHKQFRKNIVNQNKMTQGFADVTLALLHELGHFESQQKFEGYDRWVEIQKIEKTLPKEEQNWVYFKLPDEKSATDWAIAWLSISENRKKAKIFEKKFFTCFSEKA